MDYRKFARDLREIAAKHVEGSLRVAERLNAVADEMDPPKVEVAPPWPERCCTCNVCGDQTILKSRDGKPCQASRILDLPGRQVTLRCTGTYRLDPEPAKPEPIDLDALAWQQAVRDFVHGDDEAFGQLDLPSPPACVLVPDDELQGISNTFGGRAR